MQQLVSIGFPVHNGEREMRQALDSILGQDYKNIEVIISDNASTDRTAEIARSYQKFDPRIRYFRQSKNIGQYQNYRAVVEAAQGEYVLIAQHDDSWDSRFVRILTEALEDHHEYAAALSSLERIYEDGQRSAVRFTGELDLTRDSSLTLFNKVLCGKPIHLFLHGIFRRSFLRSFFKPQTPRSIRWDRVFMAELALSGRFWTTPEILYYKRASRTPILERYAGDLLGDVFLNPLAHTRYVFTILARVISSSRVPFWRKFPAVGIWCGLLWRYKRDIIRELIFRNSGRFKSV